MRLLLRLLSTRNQSYWVQSHKLHGFVYNLLRDANIHNKPGYKFFCFSNIFPIGDMKQGEEKNLIISSPSDKIIDTISESLKTLVGEEINIGDLTFKLKDFSQVKIKIPSRDLRLITATPIILRIPEKNYEKYSIPGNDRKKRYVYWRTKYSFEAFIKQLTENLIKKFHDFYGTKIDTYNLFEQFIFKKTVATKIVQNGVSYDLIGSVWEFRWSHLDGVQKNILSFAIDAGFGERNSYGFGFVNVVRNV